MGADLIGWRLCPLQKQLQPEGFLGKIKFLGLKSMMEGMLEAERNSVLVQVQVTGRPLSKMSYREICEEIGSFAEGIPECASCPLSGGKPVGCVRRVNYPIDAEAERLLFDFFVSQVPVTDSICSQLHRAVLPLIPSDTPFRSGRGPAGAFAETSSVHEYAWGSFLSKKRLDSAQILAALFISQEQPGLVAAYMRFWVEFYGFVKEKASKAIETSRTIRELYGVVSLYLGILKLIDTEAVSVLVDG